jgi:hypothetical protein
MAARDDPRDEMSRRSAMRDLPLPTFPFAAIGASDASVARASICRRVAATLRALWRHARPALQVVSTVTLSTDELLIDPPMRSRVEDVPIPHPRHVC